MSALFEMSLPSETLTADELRDMTGCARRDLQITWLEEHGWVFTKTRAGDPVVGRMYARLRLLGLNPQTMAGPTAWEPDLSYLR